MKGSWNRAQDKELECWSYNRVRISHPRYMALKKEYWRRMLSRVDILPADLLGHEGGILEVGCGPTGVFLLLGERENDYAILDPLLDDYKEMYSHEFLPAIHYSCPLEDLETERTFRTIFVINAIDHCCDIYVFLKKLQSLVDKDGQVYIAMNTHKRTWTAAVWRLFQPILEPHHPFHFTEKQFAELLGEHFQVNKILDIEEDILWINRETSKELPAATPAKAPLWKRVLRVLHPGRLWFAFLEKLGLPDHDFEGIGNSLYRHKMFVLAKKR